MIGPMLLSTTRHARAQTPAAPTPLLDHLAGVFAPRIAELWPAPHRPFVEAVSARRHLVCVALALGARPLDRALAARAVEGSFRRAVRELAPGAAGGLSRALGRLGEVAWPAEAYRQLVALLGEPQTCKLLHHADAITPEQVAAYSALTPALHRAGLAKVGLSSDQVILLAELHDALAARDGLHAADEAARQWAAADGIASIMQRAEASIRRPTLAVPFADTPKLRALHTPADIDELSGRFRNCLSTLEYVGDPDWAYYEWRGDPGVVIELHNDRLFGWTLSEAKGANNQSPPEEAREEIVSELRCLGVHVGRDADALATALTRAARGRRVVTVEQAVAERFGC